MAKISDHDINAIREKADIVDVIGHYIQVHRKGNSYVAICPFHDDHDPSMSISPEKKIYKCFVCGNGGNVYTFVQNYENITFPEAVGRVASLINYPLQVDVDIEQRTSKDPHKEALYNVMNAAIQYIMYQLDTPEAVNEKKYLEKRGMTADLIREFQIGYNPNQTSLYHFLHAKGFSDADMNRANLIRINESGIHDTFAGRITFPIHDQYGNPIGFSARILDPNHPSKYINTNETDIFTKGDIVYNYHRAKAVARKEGKIYVCEGVTDVIAFAKAGIFNAVCTLGTSCTERQIHLLKNIAAKIVFCYDGDRAGQAATLRAVHMARKAGCDVSVIRNLTGKDPDELVRQQGAEGLKSVLKDEVTWIEFSYAASSLSSSPSRSGSFKFLGLLPPHLELTPVSIAASIASSIILIVFLSLLGMMKDALYFLSSPSFTATGSHKCSYDNLTNPVLTVVLFDMFFPPIALLGLQYCQLVIVVV